MILKRMLRSYADSDTDHRYVTVNILDKVNWINTPQMTKIINLEKFNFHIYLISGSSEGPVKDAFSHHPPSRLKDIQTGNPEKLYLWGSISVKQKIVVELIETRIHEDIK